MGNSKSSIGSRVRVVRVERIGKRRVYDIEVEGTHNFVANGLVVHNCQHLPAEAFSQALLKFDAQYAVGLSATPKRFDGLDALLVLGLGGTLNRNILAPQLVPDVYVRKHQTVIPEGQYVQYIS